MTTIDASRLLQEMRAMAAEAARRPAEISAPGATAAQQPFDFATLLTNSMHKVSEMQGTASDLAQAFEQGAPGVDITKVMVESQKAQLAFRTMAEVRNRLVAAYQDVMNMPI